MPRQPPGKAGLKARVGKRLARLRRLLALAADEWADHGDDGTDPRLASWPGWIAQVLADLVLLQPLDPLAALRGLGALNGIVGSLDTHFPDTDDILSRARPILRLYPAFQAGLGGGDPRRLPGLVVTLVTGDDLLDEADDIPWPLLQALGHDGRVAVARRLVRLRRAGSFPDVELAWRATEVLLAEPRLADALALLARPDFEGQVSAWRVVERLLEDRVGGPELLAWFRRVLREDRAADTQDTLALATSCVWLCDALGQHDVAQAMRREALPVVLDTDLLRRWLECLPETQREWEEARALREVAGLQDRAAALLFLLEWPDTDAAVRLVMDHHGAMAGQSCATFNEAARNLEDTAPTAAMLLYRRGAFCVFGAGMGLIDAKPRIDRCAALWARYPDGAYDSHEVFLQRLEQEQRAGW
ncbi:MAG: DUF6880 family protein [Janthinobacterium lividum]